MLKTHPNEYSPAAPFDSKRKTGDIEEYADRFDEPDIKLDPDRGRYLIGGRSSMLRAREFYSEILVWLGVYAKWVRHSGELHVRLFDFNASSALYLSKVFELWLSLHPENTILWHYHQDDEWERESGEIFGDLLEERFHLIEDESMPRRPKSSEN